ncbi:MAG: hypothetical protein H6581_21215 [Bacteroidia bacterium]|nr:hypothetical protein [Bacteroidia bacterium]
MDYSHLIASITPGKLENGVKDKAPAVETSLTISHGRKDLDLAELVEYKAGKRENLSLQVSFTLKDAGDKTERSAIGQLNIQLPDYPGTFVFGIPAQGGKHFPQVTQFITLQVNEPYVDGLTFELPEGRAPGLKTMQMALENVTELNALPEAAEDRKPISDKIKAMAGAAESQRKGMAEVAKAGNNRHKEVEKRFQDTEKKLAKLKEDEGNLPTWRDQSNELSKLNREIGKLRKELNKKAAALAEGEKARHTIQRLASKLGFKAIPGEEEFEKEMAEVNERLKKLNYNRYKQVEEALGEYVSKLKEEISTVGTQLEAARQALQSKNDPKNAEKVTELEAALEQKSAEIKMNEESLAGARKKIEEVEASEDGQRKKDLEELKKSLQSQQSGPGDELRIKQDSLAQMLTQRESLLSALQNGQIQLEEMSFRRNLLETEHKEDSRQLKQLEKLAQKIEAETSAWQLLVDQFKTEYKRLFEKELRDLPKDPKYVGEDSPWVTLLGKAAWWNAKADDLAGLAAALTPEGADLPDLNAFSDSASLALYLGQIAVNNQTKELDKLVQALGLNKEELLAADRMVSLQKMVVSALRSEKTDQREIESALKKGRRAFERPAAPDFRSPAAAVEQHIADYYRALPGLAKSMLEASLKGLKLSGPAAESLNKLLDGDILYAVLHGNANQKSAATRLLLRNSAEQAAGSIADNLLQILLQEGLESLSKEVSSKIKEIKRNFPELTFNADPVQLEELGGRTGESQFVFSGEDAGQGLALADALLALHLGAQWSKYLKTSFYLDTLTDHLRGLDSNEEVSPEVAAAFESHKNESLAEVLRRLNGAGQELAPVVEAWKGLTAP